MRSAKFSLFILISLLCLFGVSDAQEVSNEESAKAVEIIQSKRVIVRDTAGQQLRIFIGDVIFKHEEAYLYCDSAVLSKATQTLYAYGNVVIEEGDSIYIEGDTLTYTSNQRLAVLTGNVYLTDKRMELFTDKLYYETRRRYAYYLSHARIIDSTTVIESKKGFFDGRTDEVTFRDSVVILDPNYNVRSDTLRHNLTTNINFFHGPTWIIEPSNDKIYCENGWFDQVNDLATFGVNTIVYHGNQRLYSDSLYYEMDNGFGRSYKNMRWYDLDQNLKITGDYAEYYQDDQFLMSTTDPVLEYRMQDDTLYLGADTLRSFVPSTDTFRAFSAVGEVRIFKSDFQGVCDSLYYTLVDSTFRMYKDPVIWNANNQLKADTIFIETSRNAIHRLLLRGHSFMANETGPKVFDQIKGKKITGFFKEGKIDQMLVEGSAESLYFGKDAEDAFVGGNYAKSAKIRIYFKDEQVDRITFMENPDAVFTPIRQMSAADRQLKDFVWLYDLRPNSPESVRRGWADSLD
jgi:lipopolysaccharide assembly outer membrane protein LptD (OstA)